MYYWAGYTRSCNIAKQDLFCLAQHIDSYAMSIFEEVKKNCCFFGQSGDNLIESLVELFGDINALHPFREGNGRSQIEFINMLARINGINISFINVTALEMIEASHKINNGDKIFMKKLFQDNFEEISPDMQLVYIQKYIKDKNIRNKFERSLVLKDASRKML